MNVKAMAAPRVIVNADDFGLHPCVNEAIEHAHRFGIVTSASIMVLGGAVDDAIARSRRNPNLDLGLHFCLVGVPGFPSSLPHFAARALSGGISSKFIAESLRRQLDLAIVRHQLSLSHVDSHQHLHALPGVMRVVCQVVKEYGIRAVRLPLDRRPAPSLPPTRRAQVGLLSAMARVSRSILRQSGLQTTEAFYGMAQSGHLTPAILGGFLRSAPPNDISEVVCHPGFDNTLLSRHYHWRYDWEGETQALCDKTIGTVVSQGNVRLATWHDAAMGARPTR